MLENDKKLLQLTCNQWKHQLNSIRNSMRNEIAMEPNRDRIEN